MDTPQHYSGLVYNPHAPQPHHIADSSLSQSYPQDMAWQVPQHPSANVNTLGHVQMQSMMPHSQEHVEYAVPSAQQSFLSRHAQDFSHHHPPSPSVDSSTSSNLMSFDSPQIPGSIGPDRNLSRRRLRPPSAGQSRGELPEYAAMPEPHDSVQHSHYSQQGSRPQTPNATGAPEHFVPQHEQPQFRFPTPPITQQRPDLRQAYYKQQLPPYHRPPGSTSSSTASTTSNPRSASPALSTASAMTSVSAESGVPRSSRADSVYDELSVRKQNKKTRLSNFDRRKICVFAAENPGQKQEDIANRFSVERSTVSKILKQKHRWLSVSATEECEIVKLRPSKFPDLEYRLAEWVQTVSKDGVVLSDALLRSKAREIGIALGYTHDKFKASSGWLENFKHRHGIKRGVWTGSGTSLIKARAYALDFQPPVLEVCPPGPFTRIDKPSDAAGSSHTGYNMGGSAQQGPQVMHPSASLNVQPSWSRTNEPALNDHASTSSLMYPSSDQSSYSIASEDQQPVVDAAMPAAEPVAISLGPEDGSEGDQVYVVPVMPEILEGEDVPDAADAEKAIDKVLTYARANHGELELGDSGFQLLLELKYKLFYKATGQPFDPRYMPKHAST